MIMGSAFFSFFFARKHHLLTKSLEDAPKAKKGPGDPSQGLDLPLLKQRL